MIALGQGAGSRGAYGGIKGEIMSKGSVRRALIIVAAIGALVVGIPVAVGAAGQDRGHPGRHRVEFTRTANAAPIPGDSFGPEGQITTLDLGASTLAGDFVGTGMSGAVATGNQETQVGAVAGVAIWTLTESPCGAGSVIGWAASDGPFGGVGEEPGIWRIAKGGGTGDLVNASGGGTFMQVAPGVLEFRGKVRCN